MVSLDNALVNLRNTFMLDLTILSQSLCCTAISSKLEHSLLGRGKLILSWEKRNLTQFTKVGKQQDSQSLSPRLGSSICLQEETFPPAELPANCTRRWMLLLWSHHSCGDGGFGDALSWSRPCTWKQYWTHFPFEDCNTQFINDLHWFIKEDLVEPYLWSAVSVHSAVNWHLFTSPWEKSHNRLPFIHLSHCSWFSVLQSSGFEV